MSRMKKSKKVLGFFEYDDKQDGRPENKIQAFQFAKLKVLPPHKKKEKRMPLAPLVNDNDSNRRVHKKPSARVKKKRPCKREGSLKGGKSSKKKLSATPSIKSFFAPCEGKHSTPIPLKTLNRSCFSPSVVISSTPLSSKQTDESGTAVNDESQLADFNNLSGVLLKDDHVVHPYFDSEMCALEVQRPTRSYEHFVRRRRSSRFNKLKDKNKRKVSLGFAPDESTSDESETEQCVVKPPTKKRKEYDEVKVNSWADQVNADFSNIEAFTLEVE